ncbi:metallophosphoesterase [Epilithonimonas vandammei]|uniref:metallophosphoesterase n=1 Tax=Epilithonimonas vandammei TaxID=2487072 RepID=UPI00289E5C28|nr:metallophosphoesterase [Epilithonimonas vandammei]
MIRILHLTDFHLDQRTLRDWQGFYKEALFKEFDNLQKDKNIDLILFTGDLIDKFGKDMGGGITAFQIFEKEVIQPILTKLDLDISRFIICPGNHDIDRFADDEIDENGLKATLVNSEKVNEFINKSEQTKDFRRIKRVEDYKKFEYELYRNVTEKEQSIFSFSTKLNINGQKVGVVSLNSSWRCVDDDDFGKLLIGDTQLNNNFQFIKDCDIKIGIVHHQLDWLSVIEKSTIQSHINKEFDIIFSGHVHETQSQMITGFTGTCFYNVSPSGLNQIRSDSEKYKNGFTVVDFNDKIICHFLNYYHDEKEFKLNQKLGDNGKLTIEKPKAESTDTLRIIRKGISNIVELHYEDMNNHFIKGKFDNKTASVKEAFVFPPIDKGAVVDKSENDNISLAQIINSPNNILFFGPHESGKKSLLFRIVVEYADDFEIYNKIPIFIDFKSCKNKDIRQLIKEYCLLSYVEIDCLLNDGNFILIIDNLDFNENSNVAHLVNKLHKFNNDFPKNKIIASYDTDFLNIFPSEIVTYCKIPFSYYYIKNLRTNEIKQIMKKWLPEERGVHKYDNLEKLVQTFTSYHLPNNALSVHLYLWSLENSERKPINQAVLMEIYIELILEKLREENIYSNSFDFTNKIQLISMLAEKMIKSEDGKMMLPYSTFVKEVEIYIKEKVGFTFDVDVICQYLLERKIFIKSSENEVMFSHLCFSHFFTAKRMQFNSAFKNYILDESRYFNYVKEIDYYTGLVRSDLETFNLIYKRFLDLFEPMTFILDDVNPDEYFNTIIKKKKDEKVDEIEEENDIPLARNIELATIKDSRPTSTEIEKKFDEQLERISPVKNDKKKIKKMSILIGCCL